jgi:macrolide-specific efflux system membrane fusion protein
MTRKNTLRWITIALGLVALGAVAKWQFFPAAQPPSFVTATATTTDLQDTVLATGTLQAFKQVSVGAQVSGQVKVLHVALGDKVKAGQLIAEIDSVPQQNTQRNAEAALANVQAQLRAQQATQAQTALALQRQKELFAADAGSRADLESAQAANDLALANVDGLKAQILQAQVTVDTAKVNMGYTRIVAPIDGQVVAIVTQQGQTVNANQSTPTIIKLAQTETMTVKTQISEADVTRVKIGQKVYFTILGEPDKRYTATLRSIEPAPDSILTDTTTSTTSSTTSTAIYYNGLFDAPNPDGKLRISMTAQVQIVRADAPGALTIPATALGPRGKDGSYIVRVVGADGQAQPRSIKVGLNTNVSVQVLEGLSEGDKVVIGDAATAPSKTGAQGGMRPPMRL